MIFFFITSKLAYSNTDAFYEDFSLFQVRYSKQKFQAIDYLTDLNKRMSSALDVGNYTRAKGLSHLSHLYLTNGIPGVVEIDTNRTATAYEMGIIGHAAQLSSHAFIGSACDQEGLNTTSGLTEELAPSVFEQLMEEHRDVAGIRSKPLCPLNAESFSSLIAAKILSQAPVGQVSQFNNLLEAKKKDWRINFPSALQFFSSKVERFKFKPNQYQQKYYVKQLNGKFIFIDNEFGQEYYIMHTAEDGSCVFHSLARDNSEKFTYTGFKEGLKNISPELKERVIEALRLFNAKKRNLELEVILKSSNQKTSQDRNSYNELLKKYFSFYSSSSQEQVTKDEMNPAQLLCYIFKKCCRLYDLPNYSFASGLLREAEQKDMNSPNNISTKKRWERVHYISSNGHATAILPTVLVDKGIIMPNQPYATKGYVNSWIAAPYFL